MRQKGVTLIELVIAMTIVALLTAVAIPGYQGFVQRSQRVEAKEALVHLASNQERFYLQNNTYSADLDDLGFSEAETANGHYEMSVVEADQQGFTLRATAASASMSADEACQEFELNEANERSASPDTDGNCW